jgi:large subunit ribosomal protein L17
MMANMVKALIEHERIETTVAKAKELRQDAEELITLAKKNTLATRRRAISRLMIRFNPLTSKEARSVKKGDTSAYNADRQIIQKLFGELGPRFAQRQGGYTRIIRTTHRIGDNTEKCVIEYLSE